MKSKLFKILLNFCLFLFVSTSSLYAFGLEGGQITYRIIDTSTGKYRIRLELYRACVSVGFGNEQINIRKQGVSTTVSMNLVSSNIEITPISYPPDIATKPTTNCPSGPIGSNGIIGYTKSVFEVDYTLGKNIGWAYVGWTSCCRGNNISTGPSANSLWIQAAINTDYLNNSPIYGSSTMSMWGAGRDNNYSINAIDLYDPKYININGTYVVRDSISYQLITPFQSEAANATQAFNLQNTPVSLNTGLTAQNFLYTNSGVTMNQLHGTFNATPSSAQIGVMACVVREYRAIPNSNGIGYTRVAVGYICRDVLWQVGGTNQYSGIIYHGIIEDSSKIQSLVNNYTVKTCFVNDNKIVFKIVGPYDSDIKLKENSLIDTSILSNYSLTYNKITSSTNYDTIYATLRFNKKKNVTHYDFLYKAFYTYSTGIQIERYIPIRVLFNGSTYNLTQDTISYCIGSNPARLSNPLSTKVSWSPKTDIVNAEVADSSWIDVTPGNSRWYFVNNLASNFGCKINDSVYVKVDSCRSISGFLFYDENGNCTKDANEKVIRNKILKVKGVGNSFTQTIVTDTAGFYSISPFFNSNYTVESDYVLFNCSNDANKFNLSIGSSSVSINIPVKDSANLLGYSARFKDTAICYGDSIETSYSIYKTFGTLKAVVYFANGDSAVYEYSPLDGKYEGLLRKEIPSIGSGAATIKFFSKNQRLLQTINLGGYSCNSCLKVKSYYDIDTNCSYNNGLDIDYKYDKIFLKNLSTSKIDTILTDHLGNLKLKIDPSAGYDLSMEKYFVCPSNKNIIRIPALTKDSTISINAPIDPIYQVTNPELVFLDTTDCIFSNQNIIYSVNKEAGKLKAILRIGSRVFIEELEYSSGRKEINKQFNFLEKGSNLIVLQFVNKYNDTVFSTKLGTIDVKSCIKGVLFNDVNSNCIFNSGVDRNLKNILIRVIDSVTSKQSYVFSDMNGNFKFYCEPSKNYKLVFQDTLKCQNNIFEYRISSQGSNDTTRIIDFSLNPVNREYKIIYGLAGKASLTTKLKISLNISKLNYLPRPEREILVYYPAKSHIDTVLYAKEYTEVGQMMAIIDTGENPAYVRFSFDSLVTGDTLCFNIFLKRVGTEGYDTMIRLCIPANVSYDPNIKLSYLNSMEKNGDFTNKSDEIDYTIHFQNTGNAPARDVILQDILDPKLDISTLTILGWSHDVTTSIDDNRLLQFKYKNINLPDSTSNEKLSHGYINYSIKPYPNMAINSVITNSAAIYFDFNSPIITNTTFNKYIVKSTGGSTGGGGSGGSGSIDTTGGKDSTLAIHSISLSPFIIYPNPVYHILNIAPGNQSPYQITLYSLDGKQVYSGQNPKSIDVSKFERGTYIVHFISEKEKVTQKIQLE